MKTGADLHDDRDSEMRRRLGPEGSLFFGLFGFSGRCRPLAVGKPVLQREGRRLRLHKSELATLGDADRAFKDPARCWLGVKLLKVEDLKPLRPKQIYFDVDN